MKKAFDQTVRDLKRGVNKKVLKVPRIEQKILDATSNEPWGPHGSLLADIAQATMNYHEYQMIMNVIWKRINDTGKNWRHVYKALTVLEYLVGHGSEQVIDNIREHAYQISTLSEFQYIDSSGRDQGNNVRRKSQALVALVNDKERLQEVRQKAAVNREKFQSTYSNRPGSHPSPGRYGDHYDDDCYGSRYASRDDYQYGNGKDRDWGYKDDDRSGRVNDSHGREEDRYDRDGYRDNEHRGGDYGSRNVSIGRNHSFDDDNHSIRSVGGRVDDLPQDERQPDRRLSEQSSGAPPSYEEATRDVHNHVQEDRNLSKVKAAAPIAPSSSAPAASSPPQTVKQGLPSVPAASSSVDIANQGSSGVSAQTNNNKNNGFGEFDPRGLASVAPPAASSPEMDLFGSTSASDPIYSLALVPLTITDTGLKTDLPENSGFGTVIAAKSSVPAGFSQPNEDLFGDAPFKAAQESLPYQKQSFAPVATFNSSISSGGAETLAPAASMLQTTTSFSFDGSFGGIVYNPISNSQHSDYASAATLPSEALVPQPRNDLPNMLGPQTGAATFVPPIQEAQPVTLSHIQGNNFPQSGASFQSQATLAATNGLNLLSQPGLYTPITTQVSAPTSASASMKSAPPKDRFETRSTVWADTLSRGLVNLNISGPKINPHADIGVDFDSINRKDKWKEEKKTSAAPLSTTTMGKAMGSGSGIGRVGASVLAAPSNTMISPGMSFGMRMAMGNYGPSSGMAMNQGLPPQPAMGAPGGGYNPMIMGNYGSQQPYGGGYR